MSEQRNITGAIKSGSSSRLNSSMRLNSTSAAEARKMLAEERSRPGRMQVDPETRAAVEERVAESKDRVKFVQDARASMNDRIQAMSERDKERRQLAMKENMHLEASLNVRRREIQARLNQRIAHASTMEIAQFIEQQQSLKGMPVANVQEQDTDNQNIAQTIKERARLRREAREREILESKQDKARSIAFAAISKGASPASTRPHSTHTSTVNDSVDKSATCLTVDNLMLQGHGSATTCTYDEQLMKRFDDLEESSDIDLPESGVLEQKTRQADQSQADQSQAADSPGGTTTTYADHKNRITDVVEEMSYLTARYRMEREDRGKDDRQIHHRNKYAEYEEKNKEIVWRNRAKDVDDLISLSLELSITGSKLSTTEREALLNRFFRCEDDPDKEYKGKVARIRELVMRECKLYRDDLPCEPTDMELLELITTMTQQIYEETSMGFTRPDSKVLEDTKSTQFVDNNILFIPPGYRHASEINGGHAGERRTNSDDAVLNERTSRTEGNPNDPPEVAETRGDENDETAVNIEDPPSEHTEEEQKLTFLSTIESIICRLKTSDCYLNSREEPFLFSNLSIAIPTSSGAKTLNGHELPLLTLLGYNPAYISADKVEQLSALAADYLGATQLCYNEFVLHFVEYKKEFLSYNTVLQKLADAEKQIKTWKKEGNEPISITLEMADQYACVCDYKDADRISKLLATPYKTDEPPETYVFTLMYMRAYYLLRTNYRLRIVNSPIIDSAGPNIILNVNILAPDSIDEDVRTSRATTPASNVPSKPEVHFALDSATTSAVSAVSKRAVGMSSLINSSYLFVLPIKTSTIIPELENTMQALNTLRHQIFTTVCDSTVQQLSQNPPKGNLVSSAFDAILYLTTRGEYMIKVIEDGTAKKRDPKKDPPAQQPSLDGISPWEWKKFTSLRCDIEEDPEYGKVTALYTTAKGYLQFLVGAAERPSEAADATAAGAVTDRSTMSTSRTQASRIKESKPDSKGAKPDATAAAAAAAIPNISVLSCSADTLIAGLRNCYSSYIKTANLPKDRPDSASSIFIASSPIPSARNQKDAPVSQGANNMDTGINDTTNLVQSSEMSPVPKHPDTTSQLTDHEPLERSVVITHDKIGDFFEEELEAKSSSPSLEGILFKCFRNTRVPQDMAGSATERQLIDRACRLIESAIGAYKTRVAELVPKLNTVLRAFSLHFIHMRSECMRVCEHMHSNLLMDLYSQFEGFARSSAPVIDELKTNKNRDNTCIYEELEMYIFKFRTMLENAIHNWRHDAETFLYENIYSEKSDDIFRPPIEIISAPFDTFATDLDPGIKQLQDIPSTFLYYDIHTKYKFMRPMGLLLGIYRGLAQNYDHTLDEAESLQREFEEAVGTVFNEQTMSYVMERREEPVIEPASYTEIMSNIIFNIFKDLVYASVELFATTFYSLANIILFMSGRGMSRPQSGKLTVYNLKTFIKPDIDYLGIRDERYNLDTYFEEFYYNLVSNLNYKNLFDVASLQSSRILNIAKNDVADLIQLTLENFHVYLNNFIQPNGNAMMSTMLHAFTGARERCDNVICDQYLSTLNGVKAICSELLAEHSATATLLGALPETAKETLNSNSLHQEVVVLDTVEPLVARRIKKPDATLFVDDAGTGKSYYSYYISASGPFASCSTFIIKVSEFCRLLNNAPLSPFTTEFGSDEVDLATQVSLPEGLDEEVAAAVKDRMGDLVEQLAPIVSWESVFTAYALESVSEERKKYNEAVEAAIAAAKGKKSADTPTEAPPNDYYVPWPIFMVRHSFVPFTQPEFYSMTSLVYDTLGFNRDDICMRLAELPLPKERSASVSKDKASRAPSPVKDLKESAPDAAQKAATENRPDTQDEICVTFKQTREYSLLHEAWSSIFVKGPYVFLPSGPLAQKLALNTNLTIDEYNKLFRLSFLSIFAELQVNPAKITEFIIQMLLSFCYTDEIMDDYGSEASTATASRATQRQPSANPAASAASNKGKDATPDVGRKDITSASEQEEPKRKTFSADVSARILYLFGLSSNHADNIKTGHHKYYRHIAHICSFFLTDIVESSIFTTFGAVDYTKALTRLRSSAVQKLSTEIVALTGKVQTELAQNQNQKDKDKAAKQAPSRGKK